MIYGNSLVTLTGTGPTGGMTGPTGATGATGPTGEVGASVQGQRGVTGNSVSGGSFVSYGIAQFTIQGTGSVNLNLVGVTGITQSDAFAVLKGPALTDGYYSILYGDQGEINRNEVLAKYDESTRFRRINFVGVPSENIESVTVDGTSIVVKGKTFDSSNSLILGSTGQILYLRSSNGAIGAVDTEWDETTNTLHISLDSQLSAFESYGSDNFVLTFNADPFVKNINSGSTGSGIFQNRITQISINDNLQYLRTIDEGGGYLDGSYIEQDDQIRFFSGSTGTIKLDWQFPTSNIKRITPNIAQNAFSTIDGARVAIRSTTLATSVLRENIGSCCLCPLGDGTGNETTKCVDYVHRNYCISIGGQFSEDACGTRVRTGDCLPEGSCCVNDRCINTTFDLCKKYNGTFYTNQFCSSVIQNGKQSFECPSSCPIIGCCCVNGRGYDLTQAECSLIANSSFNAGATCGSLSTDYCCNIANFKGPCCRGDCCDLKTPDDCLGAGGIFMGIGKVCEEINCCGTKYTPPYFDGDANLEEQRCRATFQDPCYDIGTPIGGGYLVGIVGAPNPCDNFGTPSIAFGEPLECMCNPRGISIPQWQFRNCKVYDSTQNGNVKYFARTYPKDVSSKELSGCLMRQGTPFVQQLLDSKTANISNVERAIAWPDPAFFKGTDSYNPTYAPYAFDSQTCNIITDVVGMGSPGSILYANLASKYYEANQVHILWALIVAPYDISYQTGVTTEFRFKWSEMFESRVGPGTEFLETNNFFIEPISTSPIDGLLTTRLHDSWSTEHPEVWFRNSTNSYNRWVSQLINLWPETRPDKINGVDFNIAVSNNIELFKRYYTQMWELRNPENTVIRQVTKLNSTNFNGYSDWYIPSIIEMNYIAGAIANNNLNDTLEENGAQPIGAHPYWSSTSMCRITNWSNSNPTLKDLYEIENIDSQLDELVNVRNRFISTEFGLNEQEAFNISHQICNGMGMLVQDFRSGQSGKMYNVKRNLQFARFRPVRRIPIIYGSTNINIVSIYSNYNFKECDACIGY